MQADRINRGSELLKSGAQFMPQPGWFARLVSPGFKTILSRLDQGFERGRLTGHLPDGTTRVLGGRSPGFEAEVQLKDWRALLRLVTGGSIGWYQGFEAGEWDSPDLVSVFAIFADNARSLGALGRAKGVFRLAAKVAHTFNRNSRQGALRNISAHYDLGNAFYASWLDESMTYSSALFSEDADLHVAQQAKWTALSDRIGDAKTVLEIGCGWGGLAGYLASQDRTVTGISLSEEQLSFARQNHRASVDFRKQDYRDVRGQFDAIVSVEMVEALGREYWSTFMECVERNLKPGGRAAIQYISIADDLFDAYASSADFIQAYIFPGGLLIRTSEFRQLAQAHGLDWQAQYDFGLDYAETLKIWRQKFLQAAEEKRLPDDFDQRFIELWRYYLAYCEGGFRAGTINVHQVTLVKES